MSVKIKGMDMPCNCYQCILSERYEPKDRTIWCCAKLERVRAFTTKRNKNCPLQEVKE